jgi:hypothetical protein
MVAETAPNVAFTQSDTPVSIFLGESEERLQRRWLSGSIRRASSSNWSATVPSAVDPALVRESRSE